MSEQGRRARLASALALAHFFKVRLNFIYSPNGFSVCIHTEGRTVCIAAVLRRLCPVLPTLQTLFYTNQSLFATSLESQIMPRFFQAAFPLKQHNSSHSTLINAVWAFCGRFWYCVFMTTPRGRRVYLASLLPSILDKVHVRADTSVIGT